MTSEGTRGIDALAGLIRAASGVLLFTGAGISTGSGIADFRGPQGVWKRRKPVYLERFLASEEARNEYWDQKLEAWPSFRAAEPNATHRAAVTLEKADRLAAVITQNIDGLHARAGTSKEKLIELHGTNRWVECLSCGERTDPEPHFERFRESKKAPLCHCGGYLKSATISFGQSLNPRELERAADAAERADLVVALGSTLSVYPAAGFPLIAAERGASYVVINRGETDHDSHPSLTLRLEGDVAALFPPAVDRALGT
jgi:NAD-dependent deacetylase